MSEKNEQSKEEKTQRQEAIKYAKLNLEKAPQLKDLAVSAMLGQYGQFQHGFYENTIQNTPDQQTYESLYLPSLTNEGGAGIHKGYLQTKSQQILQQSLTTLLAKDALELAGMKNKLDKKYTGKYVNELKEDEIKGIIGNYFTNLVEDTIANKIIPEGKKQRAKGLEDMFGEKKEKPKEEAKQ